MDKQKLFSALDERIEAMIDLTEFHPRLVDENGAPQIFTIWLNPPSEDMKRVSDIKDRREGGIARFALQAGWSIEEAQTLFSKDAPFCDWLVEKMVALNREYREGHAKKSTTD